MPNSNSKSDAVAKLWLALEETRAKITNEILPLAAYTHDGDVEIWQMLELAASAIQSHQAKFAIVKQKVETEKK